MQYPHTITVQAKGQGSRDSSGNWVTGIDPDPVQYQCRYEVAQAKTIAGQDGQRVEITAILYMPRIAGLIPQGASVEVFVDGQSIKGAVKLFSKSSFNCRIWL